MAASGSYSDFSTVGVVGASARAAVHSLARAGLKSWAIDLFADRDLKQLASCGTCPLAHFPDALPSLTAKFPPGPILYTGGLENYPNIISQLATARPLWGNTSDVLTHIRDPHFVYSILKANNSTPNIIPPGKPAPSRGRWLRKPLRSTGGHGISFASSDEPTSPHHYYQEFVHGTPASALFICTGDEATGRTQTQLLGFTEQLIGQSWLHARPFAYCGNIGPIQLPHRLEESIERSACALSRATGLRGLWGLDFILNGEHPFPVEVNPRYTAAIEVLEFGMKLQSMTLHCNSFTDPVSVHRVERPRSFTLRIGKAVYYAPHRITFPRSGPWDDDLGKEFDPWKVPRFADIPEPDVVIEPGFPVLTVFATGSTAGECLNGLQSRAMELDLLFSGKSHQ